MKIKQIDSVFDNFLNAIFVLQTKACYTTLTDLRFTMRKYIRLVVDGDLSALKRLKLPMSNKVLLSVYHDIIAEYGTLSDNKEVNAALERKNSFETLVRKQNILVTALTCLQINPNDENVIKFLNRSGIRGVDMIDRLGNEIKIINIRIEEQKSVIKVDDKKNKEKTTLADYMRIFAVLNKNGYKASIDMPVLDFIQTMSLFRKEAEANQKQLNDIKNKR